MPTNWKYIKKQLEKEFLCEKLRGCITYDLTLYDPAPWYQQHFVMKYKDTILLEASMGEYNWTNRYKQKYDLVAVGEQLSAYLHEVLCVPTGDFQDEIDRAAISAVKNTAIHDAHYAGVYGVKEIIDSIGIYLHSDIQSSLKSKEYFVRALALLDRRCGKRSLKNFYDKQNLNDTPGWLQQIYTIRCTVENLQ